MASVIAVTERVARRIREEARKLGISVEEYILELVTQGLDPRDRALEYVEVAKELLEQAREELRKGDVRQAAEKVWGAAALAVKAYASWREGRRLASHRELWEYLDKIAAELGGWVIHAWHDANAMHTCFYEGWCTVRSVEAALEQVGEFIKEVSIRVKRKD